MTLYGRGKLYKSAVGHQHRLTAAISPRNAAQGRIANVQWGLDLADTGYNYANYTYMGTEHMDPMWLFSTWLSNGAGHLLTNSFFQ